MSKQDKKQDGVLLKEINQHMAWAWQQGKGFDEKNHEPQHEIDKVAEMSKVLLAKMREAVKGAGLTVPELVEIRMKYNRLKLHLPRGEAKELRWDSYLAEAQTKAILKALGG